MHQPVLSVLQLATAFCPQASASLEWVILDVIPVLKIFNRRRQTFLVLYHLSAIFSPVIPHMWLMIFARQKPIKLPRINRRQNWSYYKGKGRIPPHFTERDTYLLLAEFSVRTVNYGKKKRGSVIYSTKRKDEANKMFIIWLLPVWGTGNKYRTRDLTIIWQARQERKFLLAHENDSTQERVSEKVKTNSSCWKSLVGQN